MVVVAKECRGVCGNGDKQVVVVEPEGRRRRTTKDQAPEDRAKSAAAIQMKQRQCGITEFLVDLDNSMEWDGSETASDKVAINNHKNSSIN